MSSRPADPSMPDNETPFPRDRTHHGADRIERIAELAQELELLVSTPHDALDFPGMLDVVEQSSRRLAGLGALLLTKQDREHMDAVVASLNLRIVQTRDRIGRLKQTSRP